MSKQKTVFEICNKTYYSPKGAGDHWNMTPQAVGRACKEGRIAGAFRDSTNHWCIPASAYKPLDHDNIRKILIFSLYLKNKPDLVLGRYNQNEILIVYTYLRDTGYIEDFNANSERIPYEITFTDKGLDLITEYKKIQISWLGVVNNLLQILASCATILQCVNTMV